MIALLRSDIVDGVNNINYALSKSNMIDNLSKSFSLYMDSNRDQSIDNYFGNLLESFYTYDRESSNFGDVEKSVIEICGLSLLSDIQWRSKFMSLLLKETKDSISNLHSLIGPLITSLRNFRDLLPKISALLAPHDKLDEDFYKQNIGGSEEDAGVLTLILPEKDGHPSSSTRVSKAIEVISAFYDVIATIKNEHNQRIFIVSCDSGSNKVFNFKGSGEILKGVKDIIISIWDKVITHRRDDYVNRLDAVKNTLPIINTVSEMERSGTISAQEAHRLNKIIMNSAANFLETGSIIPELKEESYFEPQKLIGLQEPLLLPSPVVVGRNISNEKTKIRVRKASPKTASSGKKVTKPIRDK